MYCTKHTQPAFPQAAERHRLQTGEKERSTAESECHQLTGCSTSMGTNSIQWPKRRRPSPEGLKCATYASSPPVLTMVTQGSYLLGISSESGNLASSPPFLCWCYENAIYLFPSWGCGGDQSGSLYTLLSVISPAN